MDNVVRQRIKYLIEHGEPYPAGRADNRILWAIIVLEVLDLAVHILW